jgi:hypothetical protein
VELHTSNKTINVERTMVTQISANATSSSVGYDSADYRRDYSAMTPIRGHAATPSHTPGTPGTPSRHDALGAWNPNTPKRDDYDESGGSGYAYPSYDSRGASGYQSRPAFSPTPYSPAFAITPTGGPRTPGEV